MKVVVAMATSSSVAVWQLNFIEKSGNEESKELCGLVRSSDKEVDP